jgi:BlaI family transcriptional regulator, penicillinase repressor
MAARPTCRLGDLQLKIMRILWQRGSARVAEVHEQLPELNLAYTTVATMLRKMEDRGLVRHRQEQRRYVYTPCVTLDEVTQCMADDLVDRLFAGSLTDTVTHLLRTRDVGPDELDHLEQMIRQRKESR